MSFITKGFSRHISIFNLSIVLASLMLKPANVTHLWIEEDQVCTKHSGLINLIAVAKVSLAGGN